jgi:hypothetical protein
VSIYLYVEGGGDHAYLITRCREGFRKFLENAGFKGRMPRIVACGSRAKAVGKFKCALENGDEAFLLIDSEDLVSSASPWEHLAARRGDCFTRPAGANDEHCHLMVVCMESWFLADVDALRRYFGQEFNAGALPSNPEIEEILKQDVLGGLASATRQCGRGERYDKGRHSFRILCEIDPARVRRASPWADRFLTMLRQALLPQR